MADTETVLDDDDDKEEPGRVQSKRKYFRKNEYNK